MADEYFHTKHLDVSKRLDPLVRRIRPRIRSIQPLVYLNAGDEDVDLARRNLADGTLLQTVGTPTFSPGYVRTTGASHYFRSTILERAIETFFIFGRRSDTSADNGTTGAFLGSFSGTTDPSLIVYWHAFLDPAATLRGQISQGTNTALPASRTVSAASNTFRRYRCEISRAGTSGYIKMYDDTASVVTEEPVTQAIDLGQMPINFGASRSVQFTGHIEWNHISMFAGIPTSQEVADHWEQVLEIAADQGVEEGD